MRRVVALFLAASLSGPALADPPPEPVGDDVMSLLRGLRADPVGARLALDQLARSGRTDAAEGLGEALQFGTGLPADRSAACSYFALASGKRGDATHNLALCHEQGSIGGGPDLARAAELYEQAAKLGYAKSNCALGNLYVSGQGVPRDPTRGLALCRIAAEAGVADAQADVGNMYLRGEAGSKDFAEARRWYALAAAQHQHQAARTLGQMYWEGDGGPRDPEEAMRLWKVSAEAGDLYAPNLIADALFARVMSETFTPNDPARLALIDENIEWYRLALARDLRPATTEHATTSIKMLEAARKVSVE